MHERKNLVGVSELSMLVQVLKPLKVKLQAHLWHFIMENRRPFLETQPGQMDDTYGIASFCQDLLTKNKKTSTPVTPLSIYFQWLEKITKADSKQTAELPGQSRERRRTTGEGLTCCST